MEAIERDTDRDRFMSADEAVSYGLIDQVVSSMPRPAENAS
jgi:ATP-dependent Clp protease protease subunit